MVRRVLPITSLSFLAVFTISGCGSGNDSVTQSGSEPASAEANAGEIGSSQDTNSNQEGTQFATITFESDVVNDTGAFHSLKVEIDNSVLVGDITQQISIGLESASFAETQLPENCNLASTDDETIDELPRTFVCDLIATTNDETNIENAEIILPVYIVPYETYDFTVNAALINEGISSVDSSFQTLISYSPNGQTELSSESDLAKEINRIIQIGNGSIVKSIHDGFRSLDNCPDGGQIEEISPSDFAFGASHDRYVNCANAAVVFDGETLSGEGRNSFITELLEATMTISEPEFLDFTGTIKFTSNRVLPDTTTLTGKVEQIDSLGEVITFSSYSAHCKSGAPAQPDRVTIPGNEPEPIASIQTDFESNDNLLDGSRLNVSIEAKFNNQGTVNLQSDNGSTINMIMAGGPFPTVFIDLLGENTSEHWIVPWTEQFAFKCQPW